MSQQLTLLNSYTAAASENFSEEDMAAIQSLSLLLPSIFSLLESETEEEDSIQRPNHKNKKRRIEGRQREDCLGLPVQLTLSYEWNFRSLLPLNAILSCFVDHMALPLNSHQVINILPYFTAKMCTCLMSCLKATMLLERTVQTIQSLEDDDEERPNNTSDQVSRNQALGRAILEYSIELVKAINNQSAVQALRQLLHLVFMQDSVLVNSTFLEMPCNMILQ